MRKYSQSNYGLDNNTIYNAHLKIYLIDDFFQNVSVNQKWNSFGVPFNTFEIYYVFMELK